jgi:hypothetical protein
MRLGPLRKTCAQPAPKSRLAVTGPFVYEDQKQINSLCRTGFSREGADGDDGIFTLDGDRSHALRGMRRASRPANSVTLGGPVPLCRAKLARFVQSLSPFSCFPRVFRRGGWRVGPVLLTSTFNSVGMGNVRGYDFSIQRQKNCFG